MQIGIYEEIINKALSNKLDKLDINQFYFSTTSLDKAEAAKFLSAYLCNLIKTALLNFKDDNALERQLQFVNDLIPYVTKEVNLDPVDDLKIHEGKILTSILSKVGRNDKQLKDFLERSFPTSGLTTSTLFTGSNADISINTELKKDIISADKIFWIVSFIRWSGIRIFENQLREFTARSNASLKIITTTYMGATEPRAVEFLAGLPNTEVKISYQQHERLHAKSYIFERESNFDTAYIGSSNLSRSALTNGLEWNLRITNKENSHVIEKAKATFEYYWNNKEFEIFNAEDLARFKNAINTARKIGENAAIELPLIIGDLHHFQKEILDILKAERTLHGRYKNLLVAATGTGKTVIAAHDFKRYVEENRGKGKLLFVAHRIEILRHAIAVFRSVLGIREFGQLWVGDEEPKTGNLDHLFISVQTFNSKKSFFEKRLTADFYDFIVIDEAHHSAAESYRLLFQLFNPKILLGLTATPERMDGKSLLPDFCDRIAAEIRLADALALKMLCPFQYFFVADDIVDLRDAKMIGGKYDIEELTKRLSIPQRTTLIINAIKHYLTDPFSCKALCFCTSKEHAKFTSEELNKAGLKSTYIISGDANGDRKNIRQRLLQGEVNFVCVVDIFNEGVDIPEIDTVLFLRPTESLTVFLQQLGRGLRISGNKECLTVLDFVNQVNERYNFEEKLRALIGKTNNSVKHEVEHGFAHLPAGCSIQMELKSKEHILNNIRQAIFNLSRLKREVAGFKNNTNQDLTLKNFLDFFHLDIRHIYSKGSWSQLKISAGVLNVSLDKRAETISKGFKRIVQIDAPNYLNFIQRLIELQFDISSFPSEEEKQFALMFYYDIWQNEISAYTFSNIYEGIKEIGKYDWLVQELKEIVSYLYDNLQHTTLPSPLEFINVLEMHAQYSRSQIFASFGLSTPEKIHPSREGVVRIKGKNVELLLVTLNKSDKDFSPSTQYEDYAISDTIFHWQSQNATSPESEVGQSYINHEQQHKKLLLFVRENTKDQFGFTYPYHFLGPVAYRSHNGSKPMSINWELQEPMPSYLWKAAAKMAIG